MRIFIIDTTLDHDVIGGAQTFLVRVLQEMVAKQHEVHLLSRGVANDQIRSFLDATQAYQHNDIWKHGQIVDDATPPIATWINELRPDVYIVSVSPDIGWTVLPHLDPAIATLTIGHNDEQTFYAPVKHYRQFLTRAVGVSDEICRKYVYECGMRQTNVDWIPYGVATSASPPATPSPGPLKLAYVGRFDNPQKRMADIVKIIKRLTRDGIDYTFDLVGDGEEMAIVRLELAPQIASKQVVLHGWVDSTRVIEVMRRSEVFILASAFEGFCISLIEAMANGCCPVVTNIQSGNKQLVRDRESGFMVEIGDISGFVDRIKLLSEDRVLLARMRTSAWETGRKYSVDRMVDNYLGCFERATEDVRTHSRTPDSAFPLMESCRSKYPLWIRRVKARLIRGER